MFEERSVLDGSCSLARFDLYVRHCPKCGWTGSVMEALLRFCSPGQRLTFAPHPLVVALGEAEDCGGPGEHFHWECPMCAYRRMLPVPDHRGPGPN